MSRTLDELWLAETAANDLSRDVRELVGGIWQRRAASELTNAVVFANLGEVLGGGHAAPEVEALIARASADERRHAEICRRVAGRYLERDVPFPEPRSVPKPASRVLDARTTATLHVVLQCCLNESVAMVFLRTCLDEARSELVRLALRQLMREEVDHARIGWAHLASARVTQAERDIVSAELPYLVVALRSAWLADNPHELPGGHGCLPEQSVARVLDEALADLILPGLALCGVST